MQTVDRNRNQLPFAGGLDIDSFHRSPEHEEALARLNFLVDNRRRLGLLVGPSGSGKSLLLRVFAEQLRRTAGQVAIVNLLDVEPTEFLWLLAAQLGLHPADGDSAFLLWRKINDRLSEFRYQQSTTVLLLDGGEQADLAVLQHVARLVQFDSTPEMRLTVVLAGQNKMLSRLTQSLLDLLDLRINLAAWEERDTAEFVNGQLSTASSPAPVFDDAAVGRLHELSDGIPRRVSQLAGLSAVVAAGQNLPQVDAGVVQDVYQELIPPVGTGV